MRKLLLFSFVMFSFYLGFAQTQNCTNVIFSFDDPRLLLDEDDSPTADSVFTTSQNAYLDQGDWVLVTDFTQGSDEAFFVSPEYALGSGPRFIESPIFHVENPNHRIYLSFDHIAKVLGSAAGSIRIQTGTSEQLSGNFRTIVFDNDSSFYYGEYDGTVNGGGMTQNMYEDDWEGGEVPNNDAQPTADWWKHELFDLTSWVNPAETPYFRIRFFMNRTAQQIGGDMAGWFVDNVILSIADGSLIPPKITLVAPIEQNNVTNAGPYDIVADIEPRGQGNAPLYPDSVRMFYRENNGPWTLVPDKEIEGDRYTWVIPQQCHGTEIDYYITAQDENCNRERIDKTFMVNLPTTGTTTNGAEALEFTNVPDFFEVGVETAMQFVLKNRTNAPTSPSDNNMTSAVVTWEVDAVNQTPQVQDQTPYNWSVTTDYHPTRPFCLNYTDTIVVGSFTPVVGFNTITACITTRNGSPNNYSPATSRCAEVTRYGCLGTLGGEFQIGGTDPDFLSLQALYDAIDNCVMDAPIVVKLAPGTYDGTTDFTFPRSLAGQSEVNTITFEPLNGDATSVIIEDNATSNAVTGAITLNPTGTNSSSHWVFRNLTLKGRETGSSSRGVAITGANCSNITIEGCIIEVTEPPIATNVAYAGIVRPAANTSADVDANIRIIRNTITGGAYGIYYKCTSARRAGIARVDSNIITSYATGLKFEYTNVEQIKGNIIVQAQNSDYKYTGIDLKDSRETTEVAQNRIRANNALNLGMNIQTVTGVETTDYVEITNNEIIAKITDDNVYAINNRSDRTKYINNSVRLYSDELIEGIVAGYYHTSGNYSVIHNNIFVVDVETENTDQQNYPIYIANDPDHEIDYNNNVYVSQDGPVGFFAPARRASLSAWQFALEEGDAINSDAGAITDLPPFTQPDSLLSLTNYDGFTAPIYEDVTVDILGNLRDCSTTHRGAYVGFIPQIDLAITEIVAPIAESCPQNIYPLIINIANNGCNDVNFATTPVTVRFISEALDQDINYTLNSGTLASGDQEERTLATSLDLPINEQIDMELIINHPAENNPVNDTIRHTFYMNVINPEIEVYDEIFSNGTTKEWQLLPIANAGEWSFQQGAGIEPVAVPVYGSGRLFFNSKDFPANAEARAIMPPINLSAGGIPVVEVWYAHDKKNKPGEGVTVKLSTDEGDNWDALTPEGTTNSLLLRYKTGTPTSGAAEFTKYTYRLTDYNTETCVFVAFDAIGKGNGHNINIDRVRVRKLYPFDAAVNQVYTTYNRPTGVETSPSVSAVVANEGGNDLEDVEVYLNITGANTYSDTIVIDAIDYNTSELITFPGVFLPNDGNNNIEVVVENDDNNVNNAQDRALVTSATLLSYADTSSTYISVGGQEPLRIVTRFDLVDTVIGMRVHIFPSGDQVNGKRVIAFVANEDGEYLTQSDTITLTSAMANTWVPIDIENYALTVSVDELYIGIEQVDAGAYLTAQEELPVRENAYYFLDVDDDEYEYLPQIIGRFMMKVDVDHHIKQELAILEQVNPTTRCDLETERISLLITNNGIHDIDSNSVTFHYKINGGETVTQVMAAAIASEETKIFSFDVPFDFTNNQINVDVDHNIKAWIDVMALDSVRFNDTLFTNFTALGKAPLPVVPDTIIVNFSNPGTLEADLPLGIDEGIFQWYTKEGDTWYGPEYQGEGPYITPYNFYFDTTMYVSTAPGTVSEVTVGTGNISNPGTFFFTTAYSRGRALYYADEVGGFGQISKISLQVTSGSNGPAGIPIKVYIKQTNDDVFVASEPIDWENDIADAICIFDDQKVFETNEEWVIYFPEVFDYNQGNIVIYTETNCGGTNCSAVSGGSGSLYAPKFSTSTTTTGVAQYRKRTQTQEDYIGSWINAKRLNVTFTVADIECGSVRLPVHIHVPDIPDFDIRTNELLFPTPFIAQNCALYNEQIEVSITNMLNAEVPANKFKVIAEFDGETIEHVISETFAANETKTVIFDERYDFSAPTNANRAIDFEIYTEILNEPYTYRANDTITGVVNSTKTAPLDTSEFTSLFSLPYTIDLDVQLGNTNVTQYFFYEFEDSENPMTGGSGEPEFTTPRLYDTITYYVAARTPATPYCTTARFPVTINVEQPLPLYDLSIDEMTEPISYTCGLTDASAIISMYNTYWTQIPGGTFKYTARFSPTESYEKVITNFIDSAEYDDGEAIDLLVNDTIHNLELSSTIENRIYNYEIFTEAVDESSRVVPFNDTIAGTIHIPASPETPPTINENVPYGSQYIIIPNLLEPGNNIFTSYAFFSEEGDTIGSGETFETERIYENTTLNYTGRIESDEFNVLDVTGTASSSGAFPFAFTATASQGIVMYEAEDLGGYAGTIDTIAIYVHNNTAHGSFPIKIYLKNDTERTALAAGNYNWTEETSGATLIYEGEPEFAQGWLKFPIDGGFYYEGDNLLMLTEHDCYGIQNVQALGVTPPTFRYSTKSARVVYNAGVANPTNESFVATPQRINMQFYMNYACPSPQGEINLSVNRPSIDLHLEEMVSPLEVADEYTTNEVVRVKITNHGTSSASGFTVSYVYDNQPAVTMNYSGSISANGGSAFYNFPAADFSGTYFPTPLTIYVTHPSDNHDFNDTLNMFISRPAPCSPKVIIGPKNDLLAFISDVNFANGAINNLQTEDIFNATNDPYPGMYTDYTEIVDIPEILRGQTYQFNFTTSFLGPNGTRLYRYVYIDLDRNNIYSEDELVFSHLDPANNAHGDEMYERYAVAEGEIEIPIDAELGLTRMRIISATTALNLNDDNVNYAPCANFNSGEVEDYALNILPPRNIDPGLSTPIHPLTDVVCPDANGHVKIYMKNCGTETLTFNAATPATVTANITGPENGTFTATVDNLTLASQDVYQVIIYDAVYTQVGNYNVEVTLEYPGDQYQTNNISNFAFRIADDNILSPPTRFTFDTVGWNVGGFIPPYDHWIMTYDQTPFTIDSAETENNPKAGPLHDNTLFNTYLKDPTGKYAVVVAQGAPVAIKQTVLTTPCLNLHYFNEFPVEVGYFEHIYGQQIGATQPTVNLEVAVGSGTDYQIVEEVVGPTRDSCGHIYENHTLPLDITGKIDRVGRIRFTVDNRTGSTSAPIDVALDDISIVNTVPDVGVSSFIFPQDCGTGFNDTLKRGDTIRPIVMVKNYSLVPMTEIRVLCEMRYPGGEIMTLTENWNGSLMPNEEMEFAFISYFVLPDLSYISRVDFQAYTIVPQFNPDKNPLNDRKNAQPCATVDISDYENEYINGVYLGQNEPNPAVTNTVIPFVVPEAGKAAIEIYTVQGQLLLREEFAAEAGEQFYEFNTMQLSAGIYMYTFIYNDVKLTKKMIIGQ